MSSSSHSKVARTILVSLSVIVSGLAVLGFLAFLGYQKINHEQQMQLKGAVAECQALHTLDSAHDGIAFPQVNAAHPSEEALTRVFAGIHSVYIHSGCEYILKGKLPPGE